MTELYFRANGAYSQPKAKWIRSIRNDPVTPERYTGQHQRVTVCGADHRPSPPFDKVSMVLLQRAFWATDKRWWTL